MKTFAPLLSLWRLSFLLFWMLYPAIGFAAEAAKQREFYFSWGYNRETWENSDIHVKQSSLGNDFTVHNVRASDYPGDLISSDLFVPQWSFRFGYFLNPERTTAIELNFDHTKYNTDINQHARVSGTINGQPVDSTRQLTEDFFDYKLHNGVNHIMVNWVKFIPLAGDFGRTHSLALSTRLGGGILFPHSENTIMGNKNDVGEKSINNCCGISNGWWQINGLTVAAEVGLRYLFAHPFYAEASVKEAYGQLYNVPVYQGTASQTLIMTEYIVTVGTLF